MVTVIETITDFEGLKAEWERLEKNPRMRIFQTYAWCYGAWKTFLSGERGAKLWILRWHQDGKQDVVIFPFYIDGNGCLRFIMDTHSDICDAVYLEGGNRSAVYKEVAEHILSEHRIKSIWLQKMYGEAEALRYLGVFLPAPIVYKDNAFSWVCSAKCEDYIANQSQMRSKDKADLKAIRRKADKYELDILSASKGDPFPEEKIFGFRKEMLENTAREIAFLPDALVDFSRHIYESSCADIITLSEQDKIVALNFLLKKERNFLSWIFLYTDPRTSTAMYAKLLTRLAQEEAFEFNFGVGVYSYKIGTFRPETGVTLSLRCGLTLWRHLKCAIAMNYRFVKDYLKIKLRRH